MQPYDSSRPRRPTMQCRAPELCCSASQPFGEQRTRSHPYFGAACFRQRALFAPLVLRSPRLAAQLNSVCNLQPRPYSSGNLHVERWGVVCRRLLAFLKKYLGTQNLLRSAWLLLGHPAWCPRPGAPPGAEGGPAAGQLPALMCKCHRAAAGLAKGLPTGCWPQSLGWSSSQWCSLVDAAATLTASSPTANISIVVKHIDGGRGGRRPRAMARYAPTAQRSKHRFCDG